MIGEDTFGSDIAQPITQPLPAPIEVAAVPGLGGNYQVAAAAPQAPSFLQGQNMPVEAPGRHGLPQDFSFDKPNAWDMYANRTIQLESGFNPSARTGSYSGFGQWGKDELARHQAAGRLTDPSDLQQNREALAADAKQRAQTLQQAGLPVTPGNVYLMHQQGEAGLKAHLSNPDQPAYTNMAQASGRSEEWAKKAIWGNMTPDMRKQFPGGVDTVTSGAFVSLWNQRFNGAAGPAVAAASQPNAPKAEEIAQPKTAGERMKAWLYAQSQEGTPAPAGKTQQQPAAKPDDEKDAAQQFQVSPQAPAVSGVVRQGGKVYFHRYGRTFDTSGNAVG